MRTPLDDNRHRRSAASNCSRARLFACLHRAAFTVSFLAIAGVLAVLSQRHQVAMDWTTTGRNTLSAASITLLRSMPERIRVRAFISDNEQLREATRQMLRRYQRAHQQVVLEFIDPLREPRETARLGVRNEGELVVEYAGRLENVQVLSEARLSNALARLARNDKHWAVALQGRGERETLGTTGDGLGQFTSHLRSLGMQIQPLAIGDGQAIAANVTVVIVLQPKTAWSDEDMRPLQEWIERGGNLLWLADANGAPMDALSALLGVTPEPGLLVDPSSRLNGQATPEFIVVSGYGSHFVTKDLPGFSVFPTATSLAWEAPAGWHFTGIAATGLRAWRETGDLSKALRFDAKHDTVGPLDIGLAGSRPHPSGHGEQRIVVFGDVDFLSNSYLGLGANRALGSNAFIWLNGDDDGLNIPVVMAPDLDYDPNQTARAIIALGAPIVLPLALLAFGLLRWRARRLR